MGLEGVGECSRQKKNNRDVEVNMARGVVSNLGYALESPEEFGKTQYLDPHPERHCWIFGRPLLR